MDGRKDGTMNASGHGGTRPSTASLIAGFAAVYLIWGSTYLAIRYAIDTLPPLLMAGVRFSFAGLLLYLWMRMRSGAERPTHIQLALRDHRRRPAASGRQRIDLCR